MKSSLSFSLVLVVLVLATGCVQKAVGVLPPSLLPHEKPQARTQLLSAGGYHTCSVRTGGTVFCWGNNAWGQLGDGSWDDSSLPVQVQGIRSGVQAISAGTYHTCALLISGGVMCWGDDGVDISPVPIQVQGLSSGVKEISAGKHHTCALLTSDDVLCWGYNDYGQLGNDSAVPSNVPARIPGLPPGVQTISAGAFHTCALLKSGAVMCWGDGADSVDINFSPIQVQGLSSSAQAIFSGNYYTYALLESGAVMYNDTTEDGSFAPIDIQGLSSGVNSISAGNTHNCALLTSGGVKCWGYNDLGQLGDHSTDYSHDPVMVEGLSSNVLEISAKIHHTCALLQGGSIECWGRNRYGELGNGSTSDSNIPVQVLFP